MTRTSLLGAVGTAPSKDSTAFAGACLQSTFFHSFFRQLAANDSSTFRNGFWHFALEAIHPKHIRLFVVPVVLHVLWVEGRVEGRVRWVALHCMAMRRCGMMCDRVGWGGRCLHMRSAPFVSVTFGATSCKGTVHGLVVCVQRRAGRY